MKNKLLFLLTLMLTTHYGLAQDEDEYFQVKGPVKQVTSINNTNSDTPLMLENQKGRGSQTKSIKWYNEDGRIAEDADYDYIENLSGGVIYIYDSIGNSYTKMNYDKKGNIETDYCRYTCDTKNNPLLCEYYEKDTLYKVDSMIYNKQGKLIQIYCKFRRPEYLLAIEITYDSLNRISQYIYTSMPNFGYKVNYKKNGNIEKIHLNGGDSWKELYIYNKEKVLIQIKSTNQFYQFSNFDKYGNWLTLSNRLSLPKLNLIINSTITRIIEYYE